jgi:RimJ/RimL family protein N-acetyltransferase
MSDALSLRQVRESDRWTLWGWRNSDRIRRVSIHDEEIPRDSHDEWFSQHLPRMRDRTVIVQWDGSPVGWYQIEKWDPQSNSGEWGIALGSTDVPIGLGGMLPILALSHAFERLDAQVMTGRVLELNTNVLSIMRRLRIPRIDLDAVAVTRDDGSSSRTQIFQMDRSDWGTVLEAGRSLVPSALRRSIDLVRSAPIPD